MGNPRRKWTSEDLIDMLRVKFPSQSHAVIEQVGRGTGWHGSWIDAIVVSLWPSLGFVRMAVEVKVSRADYLREIRNPLKNAWARDDFHEFWFLAPLGVVRDDLPDGCGWMRPSNGGLRVEQPAPRKECGPVRDDLLASIARCVSRDNHAELIDAVDRHLKADKHQQSVMNCFDATERYIKNRRDRKARLWDMSAEDIYRLLDRGGDDANMPQL